MNCEKNQEKLSTVVTSILEKLEAKSIRYNGVLVPHGDHLPPTPNIEILSLCLQIERDGVFLKISRYSKPLGTIPTRSEQRELFDRVFYADEIAEEARCIDQLAKEIDALGKDTTQ